MKIFSFKNIRIFALLLILAAAAVYTKDQRVVTQGWYKPLPVAIYPINVTGASDVQQYIEQLNPKKFTEIDEFLERESKKYQIVTSTPVTTSLGLQVHALPPAPPALNSNPVKIALWSLQLRWWVYKNTPDKISNKHRARMFILYHSPTNNARLAHSLGLQKGLIGVVNAFASNDYTQQNNIVIAHELLHTVGATDKYDADGHPSVPTGLASPNQDPLFPQQRAEIMAGKIALAAGESEMAKSLKSVVVGEQTAEEIGWKLNAK